MCYLCFYLLSVMHMCDYSNHILSFIIYLFIDDLINLLMH